jgi:hypothetical protein
VPSLRLEDRIRELCGKAVAAAPEEFTPILEELKDALHEHTAHLRKIAAEKLVLSKPES